MMHCDCVDTMRRERMGTIYPVCFFDVGPEGQTIPHLMPMYDKVMEFTIPPGEPATLRFCANYGHFGSR